MEKIINFAGQYRFAVYEHKVQKSKELSTIRMIILKNLDGRIAYHTGLEAFSHPYTGQKPKITVRRKAELIYICAALNYIFGMRKVQKISDITADLIFDFFDFYVNKPKRKTDDIYLSQQSLDTCVRTVSHFFANLAAVYTMKFQVEDLLNIEFVRTSRESKREKKRYVPRYIPKRPHSYDVLLLRDMPLAAVTRLVDLAYEHDPMIALGIVLQFAAGLRPSCVCNMRQNDSPVSNVPCIQISYIGSSISEVKIDLTHEYVLRSDGVHVGGIKKERTVDVCKKYMEELKNAYNSHMRFLATVPCEEAYKPMFIGRNGKAMTYTAYTDRVKHLVYGPLRQECKKSPDPLLSAFGHHLDSMSWGPHTLRHCFTVRLVLDGFQIADIQHYRGDSSPESAQHYLNSKGEILKQVAESHRNAIEGMAKLCDR